MARNRIWNFVDRLRGDKVVWIIILTLFAASILCIFSSSTSLVSDKQDRIDIVKDQMKWVGVGLLLVMLIALIPKVCIFRWFSQFGFIVSVASLLLLLLCQKVGDIGPFHAEIRNGAVRAIEFKHKQIYVYEIVKVAMVMYMARVVECLEKRGFPLYDKIASVIGFLSNPVLKRWLFAYIPFTIICAMVIPGSNSSAIFIGGIMGLTLCIGTRKKRDLVTLLIIAVVGGASVVGVYFGSGKTKFTRVGTLISRTSGNNWEKIFEDAKPGSAESQNALDKIRQPYSAKLAIKQGGFIGKGPGQSTQRFVVPDMCSDYMFSFIVEEYGLWGGLFVMSLFVSLLARGSIIIQNCGPGELFAKTAILGLVLLISLQAFMHIGVSADIGLLTGQTLPILSNGTGAMLCFSIAFGVILSISRIAQKGIEKQTKEMEFKAENDVQGTQSDN